MEPSYEQDTVAPDPVQLTLARIDQQVLGDLKAQLADAIHSAAQQRAVASAYRQLAARAEAQRDEARDLYEKACAERDEAEVGREEAQAAQAGADALLDQVIGERERAREERDHARNVRAKLEAQLREAQEVNAKLLAGQLPPEHQLYEVIAHGLNEVLQATALERDQLKAQLDEVARERAWERHAALSVDAKGGYHAPEARGSATTRATEEGAGLPAAHFDAARAHEALRALDAMEAALAPSVPHPDPDPEADPEAGPEPAPSAPALDEPQLKPLPPLITSDGTDYAPEPPGAGA